MNLVRSSWYFLGEERKKDPVFVPLTCLCPKRLRMAESFLELLWSLWIGTAGFGSLQSTESRWIHMLWSCRWARLMLGSKQWTSQPEPANKRSRASSSAPSLHKHSPSLQTLIHHRLILPPQSCYSHHSYFSCTEILYFGFLFIWYTFCFYLIWAKIIILLGVFVFKSWWIDRQMDG